MRGEIKEAAGDFSRGLRNVPYEKSPPLSFIVHKVSRRLVLLADYRIVLAVHLCEIKQGKDRMRLAGDIL